MKYEMMDAKAIIGEVTAEEAEKNETICVISTDSAPRTGMGPFIKAHPDRYYECGIMEQGAMSVSSGLATTGKTPVFCAPARKSSAVWAPFPWTGPDPRCPGLSAGTRPP